MIRRSALAIVALLLVAAAAGAQPYTARRTGDVIRLEDAKSQTIVSIATSVGNIAFEMKVRGADVLYWPFASLDEFKARPALSGVPFLGPWANRLDEQAFYANGKKYALDMTLGNVRGEHPIHGFLWTSDQWKVIEMKADRKAAWLASRLEFYRNPSSMAQFPFAHTIQLTYRLQDGALEVAVSVENLSSEPMPISIGFHPYFRLDDSPRDDWSIGVGARTQWMLSPDKLPTGQTRPIEQYFPNPQSVRLKEYDIDDVFTDLVRDAAGRATMTLSGMKQKVQVMFGPKFRAAVVYAPSPAAAPKADRNFVCFEPMAAITNAMNLAQRGIYKELQTLPPGQVWKESFWLRPSGL